ncbi:MAG: efflux RND transporter periplasmic adaptor subunit [Deferribacteraceae bacterium]|jgi:RND family efflux transporter MFP subunit|nr:efflux RND transporter periplasmic adaptor subunit [Deferribacteraceae bacterium]
MKKIVAVILFILLCAGLTGSKLYTNKLIIEEKTNLKGDVESFPVYAQEAALRLYSENIIFDGVLKADEEVSIHSEKMGIVVKKYKKAGDAVKKGDLIALIDNSLEKELLRISELNLKTAGNELERAKKLLSAGSISPAKYEAALVAYHQAQASTAELKKQVERSYIRSPLNGVIDADYFEEGALLNIGSPAADIVSTAGLKMLAKVSEEEVIKLKIGDRVEMYADVLPNLRFSGKISRIGTNANTSFNYTIEISVDNPSELYKKGGIKPGMYAKAAIKTYEANHLMVSKSALVNQAGENIVYILEGDKAISRSVQTGRRDDLFVEITGGLDMGELVITSGQINLKDGINAHRATQ